MKRQQSRRGRAVAAPFPRDPMVTPELGSKSALNYWALRARRIMIPTAIDLLTGAFCIEHGHMLLHQDMDYDHMERHLGLVVVRL